MQIEFFKQNVPQDLFVIRKKTFQQTPVCLISRPRIANPKRHNPAATDTSTTTAAAAATAAEIPTTAARAAAASAKTIKAHRNRSTCS